MVPGTSQLRRYPVDDIVEQTMCTLQVPFGRAGRKKDVAQGVALPPESGVMYNGRPIPPNYDRVDVAWTNTDFEQEELDIPTEERVRLIGGALGSQVLWNKADIMLEMSTPASQPSQLSSSPTG
jgi:hypothetical protein